MAKRQILGDAIHVRLVHLFRGAQGTTSFGAFGREQMAFASPGTHGFGAGRDFKSLGHCLACFDAFGTSHNMFRSLKRARNIGAHPIRRKRYFDKRGVRSITFKNHFVKVPAFLLRASFSLISSVFWYACFPDGLSA